MKRKYYSHYQPVCAESEISIKQKPSGISQKIGKIFSGFEIDDILLVALIFILITDEQPDFLTILALIYIFLV